jgi:hypothetical protein
VVKIGKAGKMHLPPWLADGVKSFKKSPTSLLK